MIKIQKENVVYRVSEEEVKSYVKKGFKVLTAKKAKKTEPKTAKKANKKK